MVSMGYHICLYEVGILYFHLLFAYARRLLLADEAGRVQRRSLCYFTVEIGFLSPAGVPF